MGWLWEALPNPESEVPFPEEKLTAPKVTGTWNSIPGAGNKASPTETRVRKNWGSSSRTALGGKLCRGRSSRLGVGVGGHWLLRNKLP